MLFVRGSSSSSLSFNDYDNDNSNSNVTSHLSLFLDNTGLANMAKNVSSIRGAGTAREGDFKKAKYEKDQQFISRNMQPGKPPDG